MQLKFSRFYTDFGLEKATSSKWVTGMERNLSYDVADWINDNAGMGIQATSKVADMAYFSSNVFSENNTDGDKPNGREGELPAV